MESVIASSFNDRAGNPQKRTLELSRGMASSAGNGQRSNQQHLFRRRIFQSGARRHSAILSARAKSCLLAQAIEQFCPFPLNQYALLDETDKTSGQARPSSASKDNAVDPTPSLLSFGEAIALVRQRLNVLLIKGGTPLDWHVDVCDREGLALHHHVFTSSIGGTFLAVLLSDAPCIAAL